MENNDRASFSLSDIESEFEEEEFEEEANTEEDPLPCSSQASSSRRRRDSEINQDRPKKKPRLPGPESPPITRSKGRDLGKK